MSKKIFIVYGHHNLDTSFNAAIRDTFISEAKKIGHKIDLINLHTEKSLPFYNGSQPSGYLIKEGKNAGKVLKHLKTDKKNL